VCFFLRLAAAVPAASEAVIAACNVRATDWRAIVGLDVGVPVVGAGVGGSVGGNVGGGVVGIATGALVEPLLLFLPLLVLVVFPVLMCFVLRIRTTPW